MKSTMLGIKGLEAIQLLALALALSAGRLSAQVLFSENFDVDPTANWTVNAVGSGSDADLFFDYSTVGVPSAPNSGGTTRGLRMRANQHGFAGVFPGGVSVSPTGKSFTGNYVLRFDMWLNFNGPAPGGGSGSTQQTGAGIGTAGTSAQIAGATIDSINFNASGEGGGSVDYRAYAPAAQTGTGYAASSGVFAAGTGTSPDARNDLHPYYAGLGGKSAPAAQVALYPQQTGTTATGALGWAWRNVQIINSNNIVRWIVDGLLIATVDAAAAGTLGGNNILFQHYDINSGVSADPNSPALLFGLIDNVRVDVLSTVVNVAASTPTANEQGPVNGVFTLTRSGDTSGILTVDYTVGGTATSGADYTALPGSVTFAAGATSTNITVAVNDDSIAEFTETVILTITPSTNYAVITGSATVSILDNEGPELSISVTQSNLLESFSGAKATFRIDRKGRLTSALTANLSYAGTATLATDYNGPASASIPAGASGTNFNITPINDLVYEGTETVIASVGPGTGYVIGSPASATAIIIDDDLPATSTLSIDKFDTEMSVNNWVVNAPGGEAYADFGYNYSADGIPEAPSSTGTYTPTRGLKFRVNETEGLVNGLSVSPTNGNFTGDYRLRFDMWINFVGPLLAGGVGSTEHLNGGVGTTGVEPMWHGGTAAEGVWFTASSDGQVGDTEATRADYGVFIGSTLQDGSSGYYAAGTASTSRGNNDPYYGLWGGVGAPASQTAAYPTNQTGTTSIGAMGMSWHTVTITKQGTNVTWDIDGRRIATVDISALSLSTNVFVGYMDWYASVSPVPAVQFGLVDNVRVENLVPLPTTPPVITAIQIVSGNVEIFFTGETTDTPASFALQQASQVTPGSGYADVSATINSLGSGSFKAVRAVGGSQQYYRIRRL